MFKQFQKGFTLIELMVVIAIVGLLSSIVLTSLNRARTRALYSRDTTSLLAIRNAMALYEEKNGSYLCETTLDDPPPPCSLSMITSITGTGASFVTALTPLVTAGYISSIPIPTKGGTTYRYEFISPVWWNRDSPEIEYKFYCGGQEIKKYMIKVLSSAQKIDLPLYNIEVYYDGVQDTSFNPPTNQYCFGV
ncbi:MAG TPA: type II secretion system protein [Candidatus Paceibacterota bacterium]|nr:type II secretion system protein [Candidatus Paceibacterota bacterium]